MSNLTALKYKILLLMLMAFYGQFGYAFAQTSTQELQLIWDGDKILLGGAVDQAYQVEYNGQPAVVTSRWGTRQELEAIVQNVQKLSNRNLFARLIKYEIMGDQPSSGANRLLMVLEHMDYNSDGTLCKLSGDIRDLPKLRQFPINNRIRIKNELLCKMLLHPDGHGANIRWQVAEEGVGNQRFKARMIDPFSRPTSFLRRMQRMGMSPTGNPGVDQYVPSINNRYMNRALGLPLDHPHPKTMDFLGFGYGKAQEAHFGSIGKQKEVLVMQRSLSPRLMNDFTVGATVGIANIGLQLGFNSWVYSENAGPGRLAHQRRLEEIDNTHERWKQAIGITPSPYGELTPDIPWWDKILMSFALCADNGICGY